MTREQLFSVPQCKCISSVFFTPVAGLALMTACHSDGKTPGVHQMEDGSVIQCATMSENTGPPLEVAFHSPMLTSIDPNASRLALGDFNNDTHLDAVIVSLQAGTMVYFGDGLGSFYEEISVDNSSLTIQSITTSDVDGDEVDDVILGSIANQSNGASQGSVVVFYGGQNFPSESTSLSSIVGFTDSVTTGDFDGDGKVDIAAESIGLGLSLFFNEGNRTYSDEQNYIHPTGMRELTSADLNGDGVDDIIAANQMGGLIYTLAEEDRSFGEVVSLPFSIIPTIPTFIDTGDLDGNGGTDIVVNVRGGEVWVMWNDGNAVFEKGGYCTSLIDNKDNNPLALAIADYDNDATLDVGVVNGMTGQLAFLGGVSGEQTLRLPSFVDNFGSGPLQTGDINGDGMADIATLANGGLSVRLNSQ